MPKQKHLIKQNCKVHSKENSLHIHRDTHILPQIPKSLVEREDMEPEQLILLGLCPMWYTSLLS